MCAMDVPGGLGLFLIVLHGERYFLFSLSEYPKRELGQRKIACRFLLQDKEDSHRTVKFDHYADDWELDKFLNTFRVDLVLEKRYFVLYELRSERISFFYGFLRSLTWKDIISHFESMIIFSYLRLCTNVAFDLTLLRIADGEFCKMCDATIDVLVDCKLAAFFSSEKEEFNELKDKVKAMAITFTETATESSATLGIESAAQAIGQVAAGVFVTVLVDIALTSHCVYKAKRAKDQGIINAKEFETKIKKKVCESGFQFIGSTTGSVVGQMLIPVPIFGAFIGGLCGSLIGTGIGKGLNYGLFGTDCKGENEIKIEASFGLILKTLRRLKERNPKSFIIYNETSVKFEEMDLAQIAKKKPSLQVRKASRKIPSPIQFLFSGSRTKDEQSNPTLISDTSKCITKRFRRYSDSTGLFRAKVNKNDKKKFEKKNSLSTDSIDKDNDDEVFVGNGRFTLAETSRDDAMTENVLSFKCMMINENMEEKVVLDKEELHDWPGSFTGFSQIRSMLKFDKHNHPTTDVSKKVQIGKGKVQQTSSGTRGICDAKSHAPCVALKTVVEPCTPDTKEPIGVQERRFSDLPEITMEMGANDKEDKNALPRVIIKKFADIWSKNFKFAPYKQTSRDSANRHDSTLAEPRKKAEEELSPEKKRGGMLRSFMSASCFSSEVGFKSENSESKKELTLSSRETRGCNDTRFVSNFEEEILMEVRDQMRDTQEEIKAIGQRKSFLSNHLAYRKKLCIALESDGTQQTKGLAGQVTTAAESQVPL
ncbi:uncharacterized protein LOC135687810 [Rhopilema esculentum]|uniref:uncharacterized protein LOC135687810 n=1 Tax=Rhopilema esculentum TaxID=499914 RepID=UPI0031DBD68A